MRIVLMLAALIVIAMRADAAKIGVAIDGRSDCKIVTPTEPSPAEMLAAQELSRYLEQMSGAKFPVLRAPSKLPKYAIVVAGRDSLGSWASMLPCELPSGDGFVIAESGGRIFLVGGRGRSVLYAAYALLEKLGCRWLAPEFDHYRSSAEFVPKQGTLALDLPAPVQEKPVLALRKLYVEEGHSHDAENLCQMAQWMAKNRFNTLVIPLNYQGGDRVKWDNWREKVAPELEKRDITIEVGGHGYQNFMNAEMEDGRLFEQHPEWFGMDEKGERSKAHSRVFCTSNPEAVSYLIGNLARYVQARPEIRIFDFWPPDGARWCECEKCRALGSPSNRQALLVDKVRTEIRKVRPNLRLEFIAYAAAVAPPESAKIPGDVLIDYCPINQCFEVQIGDPSSDRNSDYVTKLKGLRKGFDGDISIYSYYRKYAWRSLPNVIPHYIQNDLKFYLTIPVQGISSYAEPGDWFAYELNHYVLGKLAWNPSVDLYPIIREFAEARYGISALAAVSAYAVLESTVRYGCGIPFSTPKTPEELSKMIARLDAASNGLKGSRSRLKVQNPGVEWNIDRLLMTIEYARRDMELQKHRASGGSRQERAKLVESLADFLEEHKADGISIQQGRTDMPRLYATYDAKE